jgi:hypothetical protein
VIDQRSHLLRATPRKGPKALAEIWNAGDNAGDKERARARSRHGVLAGRSGRGAA